MRMRTVASLIAELQKFPPEAYVYAYEGEITGVVVRNGGKMGGNVGYVACAEFEHEHNLRPAVHE